MSDPKKWQTRITRLTVLPPAAWLHHADGTDVCIHDEAGGEFVSVTQDDQTVRFDGDEWPVVRDAIDRMVAEIRDREGEK